MKATHQTGGFSKKLKVPFARTLVVAGFLFSVLTGTVQAVAPPGFPGGGSFGPTNTPLDSWSFYDHTNWTSDNGYSPISFTNLNYSPLGNGSSLVVDTNVPAWLNYNVYENDGTTNLTVDNGTVTFWFAPSWSSTGLGGTGPGEYGRLFEVGNYSTNNSYGWWSIFVDEGGNNLYFAAQTNDLSDSITTYFSAPVSWTTNYFHFVTVTYSPTNTALYIDGAFVTNGLPLTVYPGANVLANGFYIGSDSNGVLQAQGLFNTVATYNYPLDSNDVQTIFNSQYVYYEISPWNTAMAQIGSAPSSPSPSTMDYDAITGQGELQLVGTASGVNGTNADDIWITNVTAAIVGSGTNATMNLTFTIQGGAPGIFYDTFANSVLSFGTNGVPWAWMGQGQQGGIYTITNLPGTDCFLILGTPQDSDGDGLTDAYELLVSKTDPDNPSTSGDGISDSDAILEGLNPLISNTNWKLDSDNDGLPNAYESSVDLNPNSPEPAPVLPVISVVPVP